MKNVLYCAETELCKQCTKTGKVLEKERKIFRLYIILCVLQGHVLCRAGPGRGSEAHDEGVWRIHTDDGAADDGRRARSMRRVRGVEVRNVRARLHLASASTV